MACKYRMQHEYGAPTHDVTFSSLCSDEEKSAYNHNNYEKRDTLSKVRGNVDFSTQPRYLSKKYVVPESKPQRRLPL